MNKIAKNSQRGYSLIELSISLAIIGVVIAGSIVGVQAILESNNVNKTIRQTNTAVNMVISKLVRDRDYTNATTQILSTNGMGVWAPEDITSGGAPTVRVTHPLSSYVFVNNLAAPAQGLLAGQGYIYTLTGVPVTACQDLAVGLEGLGIAMSIKNEASLAPTSGGVPTAVSTLGANLVKQNGSIFNSKTATEFCADITAGVQNPAAAQQATISFLVPRR